MNADTGVDLTNCDREPIHQLGRIQPFGFLVALSTDFLIARVSANIEEFLPGAGNHDTLTGQPLSEIMSAKAIHEIRNRLSLLRGENASERLFSLPLFEGGAPFDLSIHIAAPNNLIVIEAERAEPADRTAQASAMQTMMQRLEAARDVPALIKEGARQIRALMGYDRVMVYRFDRTGSGEVVAESAKGGIGSFKGLHYPATDIPKQARELYKRNIFRIIADVEAEPVPIEPALDLKGEPLDLSLSVLRSVSPIHIEYLKNMGVGASLSISIIVEGELWGLIACHHYSARQIGFEKRSLAELFGQLFSMRLESRLRSEMHDKEVAAREAAERLVTAVGSDRGLLGDVEWLGDLITQLIPADGVGIWIDGEYALAGHTPATGEFMRLVRALNGAAAGQIYTTDAISTLVDDVDEDTRSAGLLAIPISRQPRDYVVLFRDEWVRSVNWAGDPNKPVEYGPNGPRLTPRKSFEEWTELVRGRSEPFDETDVRTADTLRASLIEVILRMSDERAGETRRVNERQELLIAELNHRVRNILAVIRGLVRQSRPTSGDLNEFLKVVDGRIHSLARAHNQITEDHWGPAPFRQLIHAEAQTYLSGREDRIRTDGPPVLLEPAAYSTMALVLHELVTNSAKYGSLSDDGHVDLHWSLLDNGDLEIWWCERDGPEVVPPTRHGFGSTIIGRSVPYDLGGEAGIEYKKSGVEARFVIPHKCVKRAKKDLPVKPLRRVAPHAPGNVDADESAVTGKRVLLLEDSLIIAMDGEDIMNRLGAHSVFAASSINEAIAHLEFEVPDVALLDINIAGSTSFAVADELAKRDVTFAFATGYGEQAHIPEPHRHRDVLQKPYTLDNVRKMMRKLIG